MSLYKYIKFKCLNCDCLSHASAWNKATKAELPDSKATLPEGYIPNDMDKYSLLVNDSVDETLPLFACPVCGVTARGNEITKGRIKLFTHTDLDGVGCSILTKLVYGEENVDVEYCNYDNINESVARFLQSEDLPNYQKVYITDISVNEVVAELIEDLLGPSIATLIDHHKTARWLEKYNWATIVTDNTSGTELLYQNLSIVAPISTPEVIQFIRDVTDYDTWNWVSNDNQTAKDINDLMYLIGKEQFQKEFLIHEGNLEHTDTVLSGYERVMDVEKARMEQYIEEKKDFLYEREIFYKVPTEEKRDNPYYKAGIVFAENYISQLGNELSKENPHLDLIVIINPHKGISFRTTSDEIDVSILAKKFGGGGHPKASGANIRDEDIGEAISAYLNSGR